MFFFLLYLSCVAFACVNLNFAGGFLQPTSALRLEVVDGKIVCVHFCNPCIFPISKIKDRLQDRVIVDRLCLVHFWVV